MKLLDEKLGTEYEQGLKDSHDREKLIQMHTMRLAFLNIGPQITNLEFFENLT